MHKKLPFLLLLSLTTQILASCEMKDVKTLLKGCSELRGLKVVSSGGTTIDDTNCDVVVPKETFATEPVLRFDGAGAEKYYTVIMVDPDAPNHQPGQFFLHMIKTDVVGSSLKSTEKIDIKGVEISAYRKPGPPKGTGAHRYIWLIYEQQNGGGFAPSVPETRAKFALEPWLSGKDLCGPVAATQFRAKF